MTTLSHVWASRSSMQEKEWSEVGMEKTPRGSFREEIVITATQQECPPKGDDCTPVPKRSSARQAT